jgi:cytochrome c oxidase cbb3-type subunit 3
MTRERLAAAIRDGLPGTSMPAWRHVLSDAQIHEIVEYIDRVFYTLSISH